jgi:peptidoglycan-associated lipoprotein
LDERKSTMKNRLFLYSAIVCLLLTFVITGCAKKPAEQEKEISAPAVKQEMTGDIAKGQKQAGAAPAEAGAAPTSVGFDKKIYFDFDKFDLKPGSTEALNELVAYLKANPDLKVKIEGNCDERGTIEYNLALGERRAKSAQDYIVTQGIDPQRASTISYGKEKPADPGHNEEAWAKNRRDEFGFSK